MSPSAWKKIDLDLVLLREPEHDVEVRDRIAIELTRVDAAHHIVALLERLLEQVDGARSAEDDGRRERHDLHVRVIAERLPRREHRVELLEPAVHVDLRVAADPRRFFCDHAPTTEIYTLSLHDALPI